MFAGQFHQIAEFITESTTTFLVVVGILAWAFICYGFFKLRIKPVMRGLRDAIKTLEGHEDEQRFALAYESIVEKMRTNKVLKHAWREFEEVLLPNPSATPPVVRNFRGPNEYFHRSSVLGGRVNLRFYNSFPNLLTGLGILGTFVGLVAGIYLAGRGLGSENAGEVSDSLQQLLSGASLAFMTSIAGLVSSIAFNIAEKRQLHALDKLTGVWVATLDECLERVTVESLATRQLEESRQQTLTFQQFSSELAYQIADELGKKVSTDLTPTLEKLVSAVEGMRDQRKDDTTEMLQRVLGEFQQSLSGSAGKELEALGTTLDKLNDKLSTQIEGISSQHLTMQAESERALEKLQQTLGDSTQEFHAEMARSLSMINESLGAAVKDVARELRSAGTEAGTRLTEMATRLKSTIDSINKMLQSAGDAAQQHEMIAQGNRDTIEAMGQAGERFGELATPITQWATAMGESASSMEKTSVNINDSHDQMRQAVEQIADIQKNLEETWQSYEQRFGEVDQSLANTFVELDSGLSQYVATVNKFVGGLDKSTASVTTNLTGAVNELRETLEEAQDVLTSRSAH